MKAKFCMPLLLLLLLLLLDELPLLPNKLPLQKDFQISIAFPCGLSGLSGGRVRPIACSLAYKDGWGRFSGGTAF